MPIPMPNVQRPMTLVLPLADPSHAGILALGRNVFQNAGGRLGFSLDHGGTVHFARFVIVDGNLLMVSSYDGDFADYIQMFIHTIGDIFEAIMSYVVDPAPTPIQDHPGEFVDWIERHNREPIGFYSGYPNFTVQQVRAALQLPSFAGTAQPAATPLPIDEVADVQGLILRGFGHPLARHFVLQVVAPTAARKVLGAMAEPQSIGLSPSITNACSWGDQQPATCWAIGITATGLRALDVPDASVATFPTEFLVGAPDRALHVGDWGANSPQFWRDGLADTSRVHVLLSMYAKDDDTLTAATDALNNVLGDAMTVLCSIDAAAFPDAPEYVHFGYRDNISQPIIAGDPVLQPPDHQPLAAAGEFLLGYESQYSNVTLDVPQPVELGRNGSFTAFRILSQDVAGYEQFLEDKGQTTGLGKEKLAAKVLGRWRNGVPLELSPETDSPTGGISEDQLNNFSYGTDPVGLRCPIGAHIRRGNPRDQPMLPVGDSSARRIMRRGLPYGPKWSPGDQPDDIERGLVGHFIGASLLLQFETVMGEWINRGMTHPTITATNDVLLGVESTIQKFVIPTQDATSGVDSNVIVVSGFHQFIRTRGSIYAFLPSLTALRWIGSLPHV